MRGNLYSRKKIRLPNLKEYYEVKTVLLIFFFTILTIIIIFLKSAYPVFKSTCETAASSKGTKIINEQVNNVMKDYTYNSLMEIEKDFNGNVTFIRANVVQINDIVTKIVANIQKEFDKIPRINVFINMGSISGISALNRLEPKFEVELESAGKINSNIRTEFKDVGINQTHHKIFLDIDAQVGILTPFDTFSSDVSTEILIAESVIVGNVPETFYNINGLESVDDTFNFVE